MQKNQKNQKNQKIQLKINQKKQKKTRETGETDTYSQTKSRKKKSREINPRQSNSETQTNSSQTNSNQTNLETENPENPENDKKGKLNPKQPEKPKQPQLTEVPEKVKIELTPNQIKNKAETIFFDNIHLFLGKKHLLAISGGESTTNIWDFMSIKILSNNKDKKTELYRTITNPFRIMAKRYGEQLYVTRPPPEKMKGGGITLNKLKDKIKKRISEIKPKFV